MTNGVNDGLAERVCASLQPLVGARLLGAVVGDGGFPALLMRAADGREWWIDLQSDPEGNGPGYLNVEAVAGRNGGGR